MALIRCYECGSEVSTAAAACPKCGAKRRATKWWLWVPLACVVAFLGFGAVVGNTPEGKAKTAARQVIDGCRERLKEIPANDSTRWLASGACDELEQDFVKRFGHRP